MSSWVRRAADEQKKAEEQKKTAAPSSGSGAGTPPVSKKNENTEKKEEIKKAAPETSPAPEEASPAQDANEAPAKKEKTETSENTEPSAEPVKENKAKKPEKPEKAEKPKKAKKPKVPKKKKAKKPSKAKKRIGELMGDIAGALQSRADKPKREKVKPDRKTVRAIVCAVILLVAAAGLWIASSVIRERSSGGWSDRTDAPGYIFYETGDQTVKEALYVNGRLVLLTDTSTVYISKGGKSEEHVHNYASPHIRANGKYVLLYDTESSRYRVETEDGIVHNSSSTVGIISGAIAANGDFVIITKSPDRNYRTQLTVYTKNGEDLYDRGFISEYAVCADLKNNGKRVAVSLLGSSESDSALYSKSEIIEFKGDDAEVFYGPERTNESILAVYLTGSGSMIEITDKAFYVTGKSREHAYPFNSAAVKHIVYDRDSKRTCVYLSRPGNPEGDAVAVLSGNASEITSYSVAQEASDIAFDGRKTVTVSGGTATVRGSSGKEKAVVTCDKVLSGAVFAFKKLCVVTPDGLAKCSVSFDRKLESDTAKDDGKEDENDAPVPETQTAPEGSAEQDGTTAEAEITTEPPTETTTETTTEPRTTAFEGDG